MQLPTLDARHQLQGFTAVQVRDTFGIGIDNQPLRPAQLQVGHQWVLQLGKQRLHALLHLGQVANRHGGTAAELGCLAHKMAVRRRADTYGKQARIGQRLVNELKQGLLVAHRPIGNKDHLAHQRFVTG